MTPIVHTAVGLLGWHKSGSGKTAKTLFYFVLVSSLPDIDFLFLPLLGGANGQFHQSYTHNIFFAGFLCLLFFRHFKTARARLSLCLVAVSHLLLDLIIIDPVAPVGFRIFYPLWDKLFNFGFFPNFLRGDLDVVFSWHNLRTVVMEILFFVVPVLALCGSQTIRLLGKKTFWRAS